MISEELLTEAELATRSTAILEVRNFVERWISSAHKHPHPDKSLGQQSYRHKLTAPLLCILASEMNPVLERITRLFDDREKYLNRPMIRLTVGQKGISPDIWLLGWRDGEDCTERTEVHDHEHAEASIYVHHGEVEETVWTFDRKEWIAMKDRPAGTLMHAPITKRLLRGGTTTKIATPYIHTIGAIKEHPLAVTIHGYYPPLTRMNIFMVRDQMLQKTDMWIDGSHCHD